MCGNVKILVGDCWLYGCREEWLLSLPESLCRGGNRSTYRPCAQVEADFPRLRTGFTAVWVGRLCPTCKT